MENLPICTMVDFFSNILYRTDLTLEHSETILTKCEDSLSFTNDKFGLRKTCDCQGTLWVTSSKWAKMTIMGFVVNAIYENLMHQCKELVVEHDCIWNKSDSFCAFLCLTRVLIELAEPAHNWDGRVVPRLLVEWTRPVDLFLWCCRKKVLTLYQQM